MENRILGTEELRRYEAHLRREERSRGTVEKYLRDAEAFARFLAGGAVTREAAARWREDLLQRGYAPATVNSMAAALNGLFRFLGWEECRIRFLRLQRRIFREERRELRREEYDRLLTAARRQGRERLALLMEAICATGIRVSEVRYLTVEAARRRKAEIALKGKIRTILIPDRLARKLLKYAKKQNTGSGEIFLTKAGRSLTRKQIWAEMKGLCTAAGVEASKVFPHNLRHLFATAFYSACRDIVCLADVLGHSSIETTRIYLATSGAEHARQLNRLGLVT